MPNPTTYWSWALPSENADPWYDQLIDAFASIDTTVHSIETGLVPRQTIVLSVMPTGIMSVTSTTMVNMGTDGYWTIASVAPYGRFVGSFSLATSGAHAAWDFVLTGFNVTGSTASFAQNLGIRFRAIVQRTGVSSLVIPNNSHWVFSFNLSNVRQSMTFTALTSLGPGNYSLELQASATAIVGSNWQMNDNDRATLLVTEVRAGQ